MKAHRAAFTLIELLVVIAIISVLASILMPALKKATEMAKNIVCMNNQRSTVIAFNLYANDNDDFFPLGDYYLGGGTSNHCQYLRLAVGCSSYSFFALMQPSFSWNGSGYTINSFNGEVDDFNLLFCPLDILEYGKHFSASNFPASHVSVSYSYRGVSTFPVEDRYRYGNFGGPDRLSDSVSSITADHFTGSTEAAHEQAFNAGFSDGSVATIRDNGGDIRTWGLVWNRLEAWKLIDASR